MKLWHKVLIGLVLGIAFGFFMQDKAKTHYEGDGSKKNFSFAHEVQSSKDVKVVLRDAEGKRHAQALHQDYNVTGVKEGESTSHAVVVMKNAPAAGQRILLSRAMTASSVQFLTEYIRPIGTVFMSLIKMVIVPLIFFSLIAGITSMTEPEAFKRVGAKSVAAYLFTGAFAVVIGLAFGEAFKPGAGVDLSALQEFQDPSVAAKIQSSQKHESIIDIFVDIIPTNIFSAMTQDHILQVVVFAIFVAVILNALGEKARHVTVLCQQAAAVVFKMIETVVKFSPYGVFALISVAVGTQGMDIVIALAKLGLVVIGALFAQYLLFGLIIIVVGRMSPLPFYKKMLEPQSIAFSTSSSKATLSTAMRVANERIGVSQSSTSFVLPLGAAINMDGTAIYLGICALFFSQAYGVPIDTHHYILLVLTATLGSIGAAGIPSGSIFMMSMVLTSVGLPVEGIPLIFGIDRILDMMRTTVNITGDSLITMLVDKSERTFDQTKYNDMNI